jgi:hypothetical protein
VCSLLYVRVASDERKLPSFRSLSQRSYPFACYTVAPDLHKSIAEFLTRLFGIVVRLKVHPALRIDAKKCTETNGCVCGDGAFPLHDFIDATCWYIDCFCESVLRDAHWGEPFFREDIAGRIEWNFASHK